MRKDTNKPMKLLTSLLPLLLIGQVYAADWPNYRGPNHDGISAEKGIAANWPASGPKEIWKTPLNDSFGSFAVSNGKACIFIEREGDEVCVALDANTGKELWATPIGKTIHEGNGGNGPRTTPAIDGKLVYVYGTYLKLACLNLADGKIVWQHDIQEEFNGQNGTNGIKEWGSAISPVVEGELVIVAGGGPGAAFLAFDKKSGKLAWKSGDEKITHATPTPATILGVRQLIFFMQSGLVSVSPKDGSELWKYPFPFNVSTASSPIVWQDVVYCSAGYGVGAGACQIAKSGTGLAATELWRKKGSLINHWSTPVCVDGCLYGIYGFKDFGKAPLKCVDIKTGEEKWSQPGFGSGSATTFVDGNVVVQSDTGALVLVKATPTAYTEVARTQLFSGKCWTMAVISNGRLYARNTKEGVCLDVKGK